jgi:predicted RecA/RadA family phage recombinase
MQNFVQNGDVLSLTAPAALSSGDGFLSGLIFGVAVKDAASGAKVDAVVEGVVELPKAAGAITEGALVYWDNTAKNVTTTSAGNTLIGKASAAAADAALLVRVRLSN